MDVALCPHVLRARQECAGCVCQTAHMPRIQNTFIRRCGTALSTEGTSVALSSIVDTIYLVTTAQRKTSGGVQHPSLWFTALSCWPCRPCCTTRLRVSSSPSILRGVHSMCPVYGVDSPLASSSPSNTDALVCFANAVYHRRQGRDSARKMK